MLDDLSVARRVFRESNHVIAAFSYGRLLYVIFPFPEFPGSSGSSSTPASFFYLLLESEDIFGLGRNYRTRFIMRITFMSG